MSDRAYTVAVAGVAFALLGATPVSAETLMDAVRLAYDANPALRAQRAQLRATDEGYVQARAGLGPQVSVNGQGQQEWAKIHQGATFFSKATTTNDRALTGQADISVVQPLYSSGAARAQVEGAKAQILAGREDLRQAESELLQQVITAYMDVRRDRAALKVLQDEIDALNRDFEEIKAKGSAGALTKTDVAESEARLLSARSQFNLAVGRLNASNAAYMNVVGQAPGDLAPEPELPGVPKSVDEAFNSADANNPQIRSAIQAELAAREKVAQAKAAMGPTVSLKFDAAITPVEPYLPKQYDRDLSVSAVYSQPLFTSGMNASKVREALERDNQAQLTVENTRRGVVQQVSRAWSAVASTRDAMAIQVRQVEIEQAAVVGNRIEQRVGTRSTFELMNAESELTNAQLQLLQSRHDEYVARAQLLGAMGVLEARYLAPGGETYDPQLSLRKAEGRVPVPTAGAVKALDSLGGQRPAAPKISAPGAGSQRPSDLPTLPKTPSTEGQPQP